MAKDDLLAKGAILQRDEETYAITIRLPGGVIDIATGRRIAETAKKFNAKLLKVTGDAKRLIMVSAIDNLVKGASGQAVQNMNIMFGFEETAGLDQIPYPL